MPQPRLRRLFPKPADSIDLTQAYAYPPGDTPWLRANMIASVDGAATLGGRAGALGNPTDQWLLGLLRALSDVIIAGAGTVVAEHYGPARVRPEFAGLRGAAPEPRMAVVSRSLELDFGSAFFIGERRPLVITCEAAPEARREEAEKVAEVVVAGEHKVEPSRLVAELAKRGYRRLLCEGGPQLLGELAAADVLDELCVSISPLLVGGNAPRITNHPADEYRRPLRLVHLLIDDDELLYARYRRDTEDDE